jgi:hypothetical protein
MALITPEYQALIDSLNAQFAQQKSQAEAGGIAEAQRRGLVNPTGTSSIEMGLRQSKVAPIEQAHQSNIGNLLAQLSQDEQNKKFQTSERLGQQDFQGGQNLLQRNWGTQERLGQQDFQGGQNNMQRNWLAEQNAADRGIQNTQNDYRPGNWNQWLTGIGGILGNVAGRKLGKYI